MAELLSERFRTARKNHDCMACEQLADSGLFPGDLTFSELRAIVAAKKAKGMIQWRIFYDRPLGR